jgi:hypothetical protein
MGIWREAGVVPAATHDKLGDFPDLVTFCKQYLRQKRPAACITILNETCLQPN